MSETIYTTPAMSAKALVEKKESLIKSMLIRYFGGNAWDESVLENHARMVITPDGAETFQVEGNDLIRFYPVQTHVEIEGLAVRAKLSQSYQILYGEQL